MKKYCTKCGKPFDAIGRWGDKLDRLDAILRLTPKHIIDRLLVLLDATKEKDWSR